MGTADPPPGGWYSEAPPVLITGTGRSGTGYLASVLRSCGLSVGHEGWWNPLTEYEEDLDVDCSWCALGDLDHGSPALVAAPDPDVTTICWQVRRPLDVVASLVKRPPHEPYRALYETRMAVTPPDPVEWAMVAVDAFMEEAAARSHHSWRLDDVTPDLIVWIGERAGRQIDPARAAAVIEETPRTLNWHGVGSTLGWEDLPAGDLRTRLWAWTHAWGWSS